MACSGCDARREWLKRKAHLAAQTVAAMLKKTTPSHEQAKTHDPAQQDPSQVDQQAEDAGDHPRRN